MAGRRPVRNIDEIKKSLTCREVRIAFRENLLIDDFLDAFVANGAITEEEADELLNQNYRDRADAFVDIIAGATDDHVRTFIQALRDTRQFHLLVMLPIRTDSDEEIMTQDHKNELGRYQQRLRSVDLRALLTQLKAESVFTEGEVDRVLGINQRQQVQKILTYMERKPDSCFFIFERIVENLRELPPRPRPPPTEAIRRALRDPDIRRLFNDNLIVDDFLDDFVTNGAMSEEEKEELRLQRNYTGRADGFIEVVLRGNDRHVMDFVKALKETRQFHLLKLLPCGIDSEEEIMSRHHKYYLGKYQYAIRSAVTGQKILNLLRELKATLVFTEGEVERVLQVPEWDQVEKIIAYLIRKPDSAFEKFVNILDMLGFHELAEKLRKGPKDPCAPIYPRPTPPRPRPVPPVCPPVIRPTPPRPTPPRPIWPSPPEIRLPRPTGPTVIRAYIHVIQDRQPKGKKRVAETVTSELDDTIYDIIENMCAQFDYSCSSQKRELNLAFLTYLYIRGVTVTIAEEPSSPVTLLLDCAMIEFLDQLNWLHDACDRGDLAEMLMNDLRIALGADVTLRIVLDADDAKRCYEHLAECFFRDILRRMSISEQLDYHEYKRYKGKLSESEVMELLENARQKNIRLKKIDLGESMNSKKERFQITPDLLQLISHFRELTYLDLSHAFFTAAAMRKWPTCLSKLPNLRLLFLNHCIYEDPDAIPEFLHQTGENATQLVNICVAFSKISFNRPATEALAAFQNIESMFLAGNCFDKSGAAVLPGVLRRLTRLRRLNIDLCQLKDLGKGGCGPSWPPNLRELVLSHNLVDTSPALKDLANLEHLESRWIEDEEGTGIPVSEITEKSRQLRYLDVSLNRLKCGNFQDVENAVSKLPQLIHIDVTGNPIIEEIGKAQIIGSLTDRRPGLTVRADSLRDPPEHIMGDFWQRFEEETEQRSRKRRRELDEAQRRLEEVRRKTEEILCRPSQIERIVVRSEDIPCYVRPFLIYFAGERPEGIEIKRI